MLEQFRVSDFLEWSENKTLIINKDFQRGSVWKPAAKIMLIDTILRDFPIPKIYMRSIVERESRKIKREVVDGQQRLRAIIDFAADKITLSIRAKEFRGKRFSTLTDDEKDKFLQYPISVDQLVNADDKLVLEIFARLNSYNVKLNAPELRHAEFQGDFKWAVHECANEYYAFWRAYEIFSPASMVRMNHDSLVAEMFGILLDGIQDGGQPKVHKIYAKYDSSDDFDRVDTEEKFKAVIDWIKDNLADDLEDSEILNPPHFLMIFAAVANSLYSIPQGALTDDEFESDQEMGELNEVRARFVELGEIIELEEEPEHFADFWRASSSSTQRIASRRIRFPYFENAISAD